MPPRGLWPGGGTLLEIPIFIFDQGLGSLYRFLRSQWTTYTCPTEKCLVSHGNLVGENTSCMHQSLFLISCRPVKKGLLLYEIKLCIWPRRGKDAEVLHHERMEWYEEQVIETWHREGVVAPASLNLGGMETWRRIWSLVVTSCSIYVTNRLLWQIHAPNCGFSEWIVAVP